MITYKLEPEVKVMVRTLGGEPEYYYSKEGVVQGDPLAMMILRIWLFSESCDASGASTR